MRDFSSTRTTPGARTASNLRGLFLSLVLASNGAVAQCSLLTTLSNPPCGDATGDGVVTVLDAFIVARHSAYLIRLQGQAICRCDVSVAHQAASCPNPICADDVNIIDALLIAKMAAGVLTITECPCLGDGGVPVVDHLTINEIPADLDCASTFFTGWSPDPTLVVPRAPGSFTIDATWHDTSAGCAGLAATGVDVTPSAVELTANVSVSFATPGGTVTVTAGDNLTPEFDALGLFILRAPALGGSSGMVHVLGAQWIVPPSGIVSFGTATSVVLMVEIRDRSPTPLVSTTPGVYDFCIDDFPTSRDPFDSGVNEIFVDFTADRSAMPTPTLPCTRPGTLPGLAVYPNGTTGNTVPDFLEDLINYGLGSQAPASLASCGGDTNDRMVDLCSNAVLQRATALLNTPWVDLTTSPTGTNHATICVGGFENYHPLTPVGQTYLLDARNVLYSDDACTVCGPMQTAVAGACVNVGSAMNATHPGVFPTRMFHGANGTGDCDTFPFRTSYGPVSTGTAGMPMGGTPVGDLLIDVTILDAACGPVLDCSGYSPVGPTAALYVRCNDINTAINEFGRVIGSTLAHEIGHLLGLMPEQAPTCAGLGSASNGLFGNTCEYDAADGYGWWPNTITCVRGSQAMSIDPHTQYQTLNFRNVMSHPTYFDKRSPFQQQTPLAAAYLNRKLQY